jgi:hypothetical protein
MGALCALLMIAASITSPAFAAPNPGHAAHRNRPCVQLQVPVHVVANNSKYDMPRVDSTIDYIDWVWETERWSTRSGAERVVSTIPVDEILTINAQLCVPAGGSKAEILQVATHGVGFDGR